MDYTKDVILLTQKLLRFNTINPPGNEKGAAEFLGTILSANGFHVAYSEFEESRLHLIAEKGLVKDQLPLVLSGHLDVVPLGNKRWSVDPFGREVANGKIYGRGASDMKSGVAALVISAIEAFNEGFPKGGVRLIITAGEELGCQGVQQLVQGYQHLGKASGIIIAEPTANMPVIGHKGGLYLKASTTGITAHSSMPHLGVNAIYKAAKAIVKIANFKFEVDKDHLLGYPTINVGKMEGGLNLNSVPDYAGFTIDIRSTTQLNHTDIYQDIKSLLGTEFDLEVLVNMSPVSNSENDPLVQKVYGICGIDSHNEDYPKSLPYLTDGSVLQKFYNGIPTLILGPGQPEMAHQTDEFCYTEKIIDSVKIYKRILLE